jgi:hypothetical protein
MVHFLKGPELKRHLKGRGIRAKSNLTVPEMKKLLVLECPLHYQ